MKKLILALLMVSLTSPLFAQQDLTGTYDTGKDNTLVKIFKKEGKFVGEIVSSDNPKAIIGGQLIKEIKNDKGTWKGKLFVAQKKEWADAEFEKMETKLQIFVSVGFFSKTVEWKEVKYMEKADESDK